jgi:glyceraldehyde-3-phosphate dehydrogenase/erythrose-4-phosphate dehydrogenase
VSSDIIGRTTAITILPHHTYVENNNTVHIVGLYDNESGFAAQIVRALQSL